MTGIDYALLREIKGAIDEGVIDAVYRDFNELSISELKQRIKVLDEIDLYAVVKALVEYRRETFVKILEYMNKLEQEGETDNENN